MIPPGGEVQERQRLSWPPEASFLFFYSPALTPAAAKVAMLL
ncbi:hypothetical protein DFW101_3008 [Solidesulfovibrio carbinoliphilus subsp. oakridgensis]|uniref:Uncharacterized protein n=1 Tax=Solidesulfovibrio carbinoliphilus subsp. oakridgensis TaxID=694327 RepID=G7Q751_9BACT|nr:hypothetical protein DFW101_3008 [Solidesulfovibrio carbinoliphilus subsp. oakridgensis]